jgi:hypothetical protein
MLNTYFNAAGTSNANNYLIKVICRHSIRPIKPKQIYNKESNIPNVTYALNVVYYRVGYPTKRASNCRKSACVTTTRNVIITQSL